MTRSWPSGLPSLLVAFLLVGLTATPAPATERFVTDPGDTLPGGTDGQLRRAIGDAVSGDVIVIRVTQPIVLSGGTFDFTNAEGDLNIVGKAISIQGAGPAVAIIDGGGQSRVFEIEAGASLTLSGLTVRGGVDTFGGGIIAYTGSGLTLTNVEVSGNQATVSGGGIYNDGTLTMYGVTISGNSAERHGGGLVADGTASLINTTISGNRAGEGGGGLSVFRGDTASLTRTTLNNVTITDNTADSDDGDAPGTGGGLLVLSTAVAVMRNTIVAGNRVGTGAGSGSPDCAGPVTSEGYNLIEDPEGCVLSDAPGDLTGVSADLDPLAGNRGLTRTHALRPGSPAVDKGDGTCSATDQRGVLRPQNGRCDIGAFELRARFPGSADSSR